ncbi:MAG: HNH endonuclease [Acidobacteriota bacterium]
MIHVDRAAVPPPQALVGDSSKGKKELEKARAHFAEPDPGTFSGFKAYKDKSVRDALEKLFHGKCAYCEIDYAANQPVDIEHYRPKSGFVDAAGELVKPGYWWLAASWNNLLPSCIDCNRLRKHPSVADREEALGKANQFPIADEAKRWRDENAADRESRLLLDPCRDDPALFITFDEHGTLKAKADLDGAGRDVVRASTKVYGLNRPGLGTRRRSAAVALRGTRRTLNRCAKRIKASAEAGAAPSDADRSELADLIRQILDHRSPRKPFTALTRTLFTDAVMDKLGAFVTKHFGAALGPAPAGASALEHFADRFEPADDGDDEF